MDDSRCRPATASLPDPRRPGPRRSGLRGSGLRRSGLRRPGPRRSGLRRSGLRRPGLRGSGPRLRALASWGLSATATLVWLVAILVSGLGGRILAHWESALTMLFGSFLSGSSPVGGGAVAFPVFTKALDVPAPVARTFGLSVQAVGMTMTCLSILAFRREVHVRTVILGSIGAVGGFLLAVAVVGRADEVFWPPSISGPWVKATFSIVLATTSILMLRHLRPAGPEPVEHWSARLDIGVVVVAVAGGVLSNLTGTGANIVVFLFLVVLAGVRPGVALPTALMVMAAVSIVGFTLFGLIDRQLAVEVVDGRVIAVGGTPVDLAASEADLLGLWLAAVPVVVWGAPLGSLAASLVREHHLVRFVALLAAVEVATTAMLVPELRTDPALIAYLATGLITLPLVFIVLQRHRGRVFG